MYETRQEKSARIRKEKEQRRNSKLIGATLALSLTATTFLGQPKGAKACDCAQEYIVKAGDSLYSLAKQYEVTVQQLKEKNGLTSDSLVVGQKITVPYKGENGQLVHKQIGKGQEVIEKQSVTAKEQNIKVSNPNVTGEKPKQSGVYIVQSGDNLWNLSKKFGVSVEKILTDNRLTTANLMPGQRLIIQRDHDINKQIHLEKTKVVAPAKNTESSTHIVQSGDSLWKIAQKYGVTIESLMSLNQLQTDKLQIGQKIIVNSKIEKREPSDKPGDKISEKPMMASTIIYIVKNGDSLWKISKKYHTSIEKIKQDNHLTSDFLSVGQKLTIQLDDSTKNTDDKPVAIYTVKAGDTLKSLAYRFNVDLDLLMEINHLNRPMVIIGQKLLIPAKHTVQQSGKMIGAVDSTSIEIDFNGNPLVLEVSYGDSQSYQKWKNKQVFVTYTKGINSKRPALVNMEIN